MLDNEKHESQLTRHRNGTLSKNIQITLKNCHFVINSTQHESTS